MTGIVDLTGFEPMLSRVHEAFLQKRVTIATAESCTGGMLSMLLTAKPDSSHYFLAGVTAYSNAAKAGVLAIEPRLVETCGAVSKEVGGAMAEAARRMTGASIGVGITGIAGPGGGSTEKPVGTVWLGIALNDSVSCRNLKLNGTRDEIRCASAYEALKDLDTILRSI